jgi:hypothetical protein
MGHAGQEAAIELWSTGVLESWSDGFKAQYSVLQHSSSRPLAREMDRSYKLGESVGKKILCYLHGEA